jgi:hypothetical protein
VATIAVTRAALAGFGVLRRKPWAPVVWSGFYIVVLVAILALVGGAFLTAIGKINASAAHPLPPEQILGLFGAVFVGYFVMILAFWVIGAVVNMAVVRAVLEPEAAAFAYMRLGAAELWLMAANFVLYILYLLGSMAVAIPIGIAAGMTALVWRDGAPFVSLSLQVVTWGVTIWLWLRFCMIPPMILAERRFRLFESWTMTRGHVGSLFGVGAILFLASLAVYVVLAGIGLAIGWPMFQQLGSTFSPRAFITQAPAQVWREMTPFLALYAVLVWIGSIVLLPVSFAPWAEVYRQLTHGELAATFS